MFHEALRHQQEGRIHDAVALYKRVLAFEPGYADAHNNLAAALEAQGRIEEAMAHYERALVLKPGHARAHNNLGVVLVKQGRIEEALAHYERALALQPDYANAHNNLGIALEKQGRIDEAVAHYELALGIRPDHAGIHNNLGLALAQQGRIDEAVAHYERALTLKPDYAIAHNNLGVALEKQSKIDEAVAHYERAIVLKPEYASAHNNLGLALVKRGRIDEAVVHYERALVHNPEHDDAHNNLGVALTKQGRIDEAAAHYQRARVLNPGHVDALNNLAALFLKHGSIDDATTHYRRAIEIDPDNAEAHHGLGNIFTVQGKFDDATAHFGRAIAIRPDYAEVHFNRAEIKNFRDGDADLAALEALADRNGLSADKGPFIHFALAKAREDIGDYARAFEHLRKGNDLKRRQIHYDEPAIEKLFQRIPAVFESALFDRFQEEGDPSSAPVFVVGMPRSGSSLIEQILASHPQIHGAGELTDLEAATNTVLTAAGRLVPFPEFVPTLDGATVRRIGQAYVARLPALADGRVRIVDKMPGNFLKVGLIRLILPHARIIHTMRDPIDTSVSCYSRLFTFGQEFSYDLGELGRYYRRYHALMTYWRSVLPPGAMLDVSYEDVVDDLEGQARRLIDYCGLPWDDRCLNFHRTVRPVKTASAVQVRKPLFRSSLQRWRRYEANLGPLLQELGLQPELKV
jgi:tetratricopeptide (TPR) repeat protein